MIRKKKLQEQIASLEGRLAKLSTRLSVAEEGLEACVDAYRENLGTHERYEAHFRDIDDFFKGLQAALKAEKDKPLADLFTDMEDAFVDFGKACDAAVKPAKRTTAEVKREATERNLISIGGLWHRYGWKQRDVVAACRQLGVPFEKIEGSDVDYISKAEIAKIKAFLGKK